MGMQEHDRNSSSYLFLYMKTLINFNSKDEDHEDLSIIL
jgi:hypothetical protein